MKKLTRSVFRLTLLLTFLLVPSLAEAEQRASSKLLLPYFEVDLDGGLTTLFAVSNASEVPASFSVTVYTNWGISVLREPLELGGGGLLTVNLSDWLRHGRLPRRQLAPRDLEHLQAALGARRSPETSLFYGTEVAPRRAVGYLEITGHGSPRVDSLWGDYFVTDPQQNLAQGESLISLDAGDAGACRRHALRFLDGGAFDGGTPVIIWTGKRGRPSSTGFYLGVDAVEAETSFFDAGGQLSDRHSSDFKAVEIMDVSSLGLSDPFGWLEIRTARASFVSVRYSAMNRFSVGLRSFCLSDPIGPRLELEVATNGEDADAPMGPVITAGFPVEWTYVVTNTGDEDLVDVTVSDDQGVDVICPDDSLAAGRRMTCRAEGIAVGGQRRNVGRVIGWSSEGLRVADSDLSHHFADHGPIVDPPQSP